MRDRAITVVTIHKGDFTPLSRTLKSVSSQTMSKFEYIVVASGLSSQEKICVRKYTTLTFFDMDNSLYDAMNLAIKHASGDHILFLNSGDVFVDACAIERACNSIDSPSSCYIAPVIIEFCGLRYLAPSINKMTRFKHSAHQGFFAPISFRKIYFNTNDLLYADSSWMESYKALCCVCMIKSPVVVFEFNGISSIPQWNRIPCLKIHGLFAVLSYIAKIFLSSLLPTCLYSRFIMLVNRHERLH